MTDSTEDRAVDETLASSEGPDAQGQKFSEAYVNKLREESKTNRIKYRETADELSAVQQRLSEVQAAADAASSQAERLAAFESKAMRYEAAAAANLSLKHAARLQGSTMEELMVDAKKFAEEVAPDTRKMFSPGATDVDSKKSPAEKLVEMLKK